MRGFIYRIINFIKKYPWLLILVAWIVLYYPLWIGLVPAPADLLIGAYEPWYSDRGNFYTNGTIKNPVISDVTSQLYVWKTLAADLWRQGVVPLWDPYTLSGHPLLANLHSAVLFPTVWLLVWLGDFWGWSLHISLQTLVAGLGMYIFLGNYKFKTAPRYLGAVILGIGGVMTTSLEFGSETWGIAFAPWLLHAGYQFIHKNSWKWVWMLSPGLVLLIFSTHGQIVFFVCLLVASYCLFELTQAKLDKGQKLIKIICLGLVGVIGLLLSAAQLLPTWELLNSSIKQQEANIYTEAFVEWWKLVRFWAADFYGSPITRNSVTNNGIEYIGEMPFISSIGLPFVLVSLFALRKNKKLVYWWLIFGFSLLLATGNPLSRWLYGLELTSLSYSPASRWLSLNLVAGGVLAAYGLNAWLNSEHIRKTTAKISLFLILITLTAIGWIWYELNQSELNVAMRNAILPVGLLGGLFIVSWRSFFKVSWTAHILVLVAFIDLFIFFHNYNPFVKPEIIFPTNSVLSWLQQESDGELIAVEKTALLPPNTWMPYELRLISGYDPLMPLSYAKWFNLVTGGKWEGESVSRFAELDQFEPERLRKGGVTYIIVSHARSFALEDALTLVGYTTAFKNDSVTVYENKQLPGRYFWANEILTAESESDFINLIQDESFWVSDSVVVLDHNIMFSKAEKENVQLLVNRSDNNNLVFQTERSSKGLLVLRDTWTEGWYPYVDGKKFEPILVNGIYRGVFVPEGNHEVVWSYQPRGWYWGWRISVAATILWIIWGFGLYNFHKRQ